MYLLQSCRVTEKVARVSNLHYYHEGRCYEFRCLVVHIMVFNDETLLQGGRRGRILKCSGENQILLVTHQPTVTNRAAVILGANETNFSPDQRGRVVTYSREHDRLSLSLRQKLSNPETLIDRNSQTYFILQTSYAWRP